MRPNNQSGANEAKEEQSVNEQRMQPPQAAAKREVQEAEKKAESAKREVQEAREELQSEIEEAKETIEEIEAAVDVLDEWVKEVQDAAQTQKLGQKLKANPETAREAAQERMSDD
jgi:DNA-binding transcriptional regulator GbsR (MarR family)